jgi:glycosyltransferase involved in cell wall biosynthesis
MPAQHTRIFRTPGLTSLIRLLTIRRARRKIQSAAEASNLIADVTCENHALVFCYRLSSFALIESLTGRTVLKTAPLVVDFDDIESRVLERVLDRPESRMGAEQRLMTRIELIETRLTESRALRRAAMVSVCSVLDAGDLMRRSPGAPVRVVPNSFPACGPILPRQESAPVRALFLGTMTYHPNEDAVLFFCNQVLPLLRAEPSIDIEIDIVGRGPSSQVMALAELPGVNVIGGVEQVEPYYAAADFVIVPVRYGGGTRIKILEALALGRPIVSTSIGAEGLELRPGKDILIADTPEEFALCCRKLAQDHELQRSIAASGRQRFMTLYEAEHVRCELTQALLELCSAT